MGVVTGAVVGSIAAVGPAEHPIVDRQVIAETVHHRCPIFDVTALSSRFDCVPTPPSVLVVDPAQMGELTNKNSLGPISLKLEVPPGLFPIGEPESCARQMDWPIGTLLG